VDDETVFGVFTGRLHGAARDLGNPDAAGIAVGKIDLNGLRARTGHV